LYKTTGCLYPALRLRAIHWLLIRRSIYCKLAILVYKTLTISQQSYMSPISFISLAHHVQCFPPIHLIDPCIAHHIEPQLLSFHCFEQLDRPARLTSFLFPVNLHCKSALPLPQLPCHWTGVA